MMLFFGFTRWYLHFWIPYGYDRPYGDLLVLLPLRTLCLQQQEPLMDVGARQ
jgi:hypothetical protein